MKGSSGFSLIEVLSGSVISTVLVGAVLSVIYMASNNVKDGTVRIRMNDLMVVTSDQIHQTARSAYGVKLPSEANGATPSPAPDAFNESAGLSEIRFYDHDNNFLKCYRIGSRYLEEGEVIGGILTYKPFVVGIDTVVIDPAQSTFFILDRRRGVRFKLKYSRVVGSTPYSLPARSELAMCRNNYQP